VCGTGTLEVPSESVLTMAYPNFFNEMRASMVPLQNQRKGWDYNTYSMLVCLGKTRGNVYENTLTGSLDIITSFLNVVYPNMIINPYLFENSVGSIIQIFDPADFTHSWIVGDDVDPAIQALSVVCNTLQGNVTMATCQSNFHDQHTVNYYTKLCNIPENIKEFILDKDGKNLGSSAPLSNYQLAVVVEITNRVPFSPDAVSFDLMNILPVSFSSLSTYQPIYNETSGIEYDALLQTIPLIIQTMLTYVHQVSGEGTETGIGHVALIAQHMGGGFVNFIKMMGKSMLPALDQIPGVGRSLHNVGDDLLNMLSD